MLAASSVMIGYLYKVYESLELLGDRLVLCRDPDKRHIQKNIFLISP